MTYDELRPGDRVRVTTVQVGTVRENEERELTLDTGDGYRSYVLRGLAFGAKNIKVEKL